MDVPLFSLTAHLLREALMRSFGYCMWGGWESGPDKVSYFYYQSI